MSEEEHPSLILSDTHAISILLYIGEHDGCTRTDVYTNVVRSSNAKRKIDRLVSAGLLDLNVEGLRGRLWLTDVGKGVVERIREIDELMKRSETETDDD